jgi:hypothetical protein
VPDEEIMGHTQRCSLTTMRSYDRRAKLSQASPAGKLGLLDRGANSTCQDVALDGFSCFLMSCPIPPLHDHSPATALFCIAWKLTATSSFHKDELNHRCRERHPLV